MDRTGTDAREALRRLRAAVSDGRLDALAERFDLTLLVLFGSAAHGEDLPNDVDLGYLTNGDLDHWRLLSALYELMGTESVDLVDLTTANVVLRSEVLGGEPLVERVAGTFADAQMAANVQRMDTRWLRLMSLETMAAGGRTSVWE